MRIGFGVRVRLAVDVGFDPLLMTYGLCIPVGTQTISTRRLGQKRKAKESLEGKRLFRSVAIDNAAESDASDLICCAFLCTFGCLHMVKRQRACLKFSHYFVHVTYPDLPRVPNAQSQIRSPNAPVLYRCESDRSNTSRLYGSTSRL